MQISKKSATQGLDVMVAVTAIADAYSAFDQNAACARGWCLNEYGDGMIGIVKDDDGDVFANSDDARDHVALACIVDDQQAYRDLCRQAICIEAASIALRDAMEAEEEEVP